ncbi:MAG: homoserine dehydrogenase [Desulfomonile tiedjei]|nr:homoserine dehydrogenase [Desulfomonile tiedjei]
MKEISIGLIGFGIVGSGVVKILEENRDLLEARVGIPLRVKAIADLDIQTDRGVKVDRAVLTTDARQVLEDPEISIVVELIGGYEPARTFILQALGHGKMVVTANKALLAESGDEIFRAAHQSGVDVGFEAAVAGGIPILRSLREGLVANRFDKVMAILNGTCNFILTSMYDNPGVSFSDVLRQAQEMGYAEADPSLDVDGIDSAHKLVLVLGMTHGIRVRVSDLCVEGIRGITSFDVKMAKEFAYKIKLLALIISRGDMVEARVHPTMIPQHHPLATVDGVFNGIYLKGNMVGEQLFYGRGAGREPTASAVIGDIVECARNAAQGRGGLVPPLGYPEDWTAPVRVMDMNAVSTNYYLRVQAKDRPGVLSKISGIMADHCISIHSVVQKGRDASGSVPVVFITHRATEADIQAASTKIGELDVVDGRPTILRIEDETLD